MQKCHHCNNDLVRQYYRNHHDNLHQDILTIWLCHDHAAHHEPVHNDAHEVIYQLQLINQKLHKMSQTGDELKALVQQSADSLVKIRTDIGTLVGEINPNGLTAQEVADLKDKLTALAGDAASVDALTPDPEQPAQ